MIKSLAAATTLAILLAGPAFAQAPAATPAPTEAPAASTAPAQAGTPAQAPAPAATETAGAELPTTPEACIEAAAKLGEIAEGKTFTDAMVEKLDKLFTDMEQLCDGKKFTEAMAVHKDIKSVLDGN